MKKFEHELEELKKQMLSMSELTTKMVDLAAEAIKNRSKDFHPELAPLEKQLDHMQMEIDHEAVRMLTVYGPVATQLRYILVVNHVTAQMERIGDQVMNVCESLQLMRSQPDHGTLSKLQKMADLTCEIVRDSLDSYFDDDPKKAQITRTHDDLVDALNSQIMQQLLSDDVLRGVLKGTEDLADAVAQILIARHLERIADQAVNICKEVVFLVEGEDVRHPSENPETVS